MRTYINLQNSHDYELPDQFKDDDVRYAAKLVEHFLTKFTKKGDSVLDPFAGFGTTLYVSQLMERVPYGIEFDSERFKFIERHLTNGVIINGDALRILEYDLPQIDFCMTSPPYMRPQDKHNALTANTTLDGNYQTYLQNLKRIYESIGQKLNPKARVVIEVSNVKHELGVTPLAWHIAEAVSEVLTFEGEVIACWDKYGFGYDHSYCLLFSV